jgi:hypothetical protein
MIKGSLSDPALRLTARAGRKQGEACCKNNPQYSILHADITLAQRAEPGRLCMDYVMKKRQYIRGVMPK